MAFNPFLAQYSQEARMYSLVALLAIPATACFLRAYALDAPNRRPWIAGFAVSVAVSLYTHNWPIFFTASAAIGLGRAVEARPKWRRRELVRDGLLGFGGAFVLYLPWVPTTLYQAAHTGAPWSDQARDRFAARRPWRPARPDAADRAADLRRRRGPGAAPAPRWPPPTRAASWIALVILGIGTPVLAWALSQTSPAWANRYLAVALAPYLLLAAGGLAHARRLGIVGLVLVVIMWAQDAAPVEKRTCAPSRARSGRASLLATS